MCKTFSFSVDRQGKIYALLGIDRAYTILMGKNPDSHTYISSSFGIKEDETWKYEIPLWLWQIEKEQKTHSVKSYIEKKLVYNGGLPKTKRTCSIRDIMIKNLRYEGGLPETELKIKHVNAIRHFLYDLDWEENVFKPQDNPSEFSQKRILDTIKSAKYGKYDFLIQPFIIFAHDVEKILEYIGNPNLLYSSGQYLYKFDWGEVIIRVPTDPIHDGKKVFLTLLVNRYYKKGYGYQTKIILFFKDKYNIDISKEKRRSELKLFYQSKINII